MSESRWSWNTNFGINLLMLGELAIADWLVVLYYLLSCSAMPVRMLSDVLYRHHILFIALFDHIHRCWTPPGLMFQLGCFGLTAATAFILHLGVLNIAKWVSWKLIMHSDFSVLGFGGTLPGWWRQLHVFYAKLLGNSKWVRAFERCIELNWLARNILTSWFFVGCDIWYVVYWVIMG